MKTNETSKPTVLYNKEFNDYAYWNGSQYVGKIQGACFYGLEKAANNGYLPIDSTREQALVWWNSLSSTKKEMECMIYRRKNNEDSINYHSLTGREIEEIWLKETQEQQYSLYDSNMKHTEDCGKIIVRESKPNKETSTKEQASKWFSSKSYLEQHSLSDKYFESKNPSLLTIEQVLEIYDKEILEPKRQKEWQESQVNRRYSKPNAKEFKQFDESLFRAYIDKLPESESLNMIKIIYENKLPDCKFKAHLDKWFKL